MATMGDTQIRVVFCLCLALIPIAAALADDDCLLHCPTRPGPFGQPERDRDCVLRCLQSEGLPQSPPPSQGRIDSKPAPASTLRFSAAWNATAAFQKQRLVVEQLVNAIPDEVFKAWVSRHVVFDRVSRGPTDWRAGIRPGVLVLYDPFGDLNPNAQVSVLTFELGKALWFARINPGAREERPPLVLEFEALFRRHQSSIQAMQFASWHGENLGDLTDRDLQSSFAYACRAALFNLEPPSPAPAGYSPEDWKRIVRDWRGAQADVKRYLAKVLGE